MKWEDEERQERKRLMSDLYIMVLTELDQYLQMAQQEYDKQFDQYDFFSKPALNDDQEKAKTRLMFYRDAIRSLQVEEKNYRDTPISFDEWKEQFPITWKRISDQLEDWKGRFLLEYNHDSLTTDQRKEIRAEELERADKLLKQREAKHGDSPVDFYDPIVNRNHYRWVNVKPAAAELLLYWLYFKWLESLDTVQFESLFRFSGDAELVWSIIQKDEKARGEYITAWAYGLSSALVDRKKINDDYSAEDVTRVIAKKLGTDLTKVRLGKKVKGRQSYQDAKDKYKLKINW